MALELVKENIEYEQLLGENTTDTVVKGEYIIPDTNPDVKEILMVDSKPCILSKEVMQDKVYLEGQIQFNVLYLTIENEKSNMYNVTYNSKFSNYIEVSGALHKMMCNADCYVEHIECRIANERKITVEAILRLNSSVYQKCEFDIVKDVSGLEDVQMLKSPMNVDKICGKVETNLVAKSHIQVPMEKPQIGSIVMCDVHVHKKSIKILEGKVLTDAFALVKLLYKGKDTRDLFYMEDDVLINGESELQGANSSMSGVADLRVDAMEYNVKEDDLAEDRIVDIEAIVKSDVQVSYKEELDMIEDVYSPRMIITSDKKNYDLNSVFGRSSTEVIAKENLEIAEGMPAPTAVIMTNGRPCITDKRIVEDKVIIEGVVNTDIIYTSNDESRYMYAMNEDIPFSCAMDIPGCKIDMQCFAKAFIENIEASVEASTIAVKCVISVCTSVKYFTHKEFLVGLTPLEGEIPKKKASVTIYIVQSGDTLWKIAKNYGTTVDNLIKINNIEDPENIKPGFKMIIPGRAII